MTPNKRLPVKSITLSFYIIIKNEAKETSNIVVKDWKNKFSYYNKSKIQIGTYMKFLSHRNILLKMSKFLYSLEISCLENDIIEKFSNNFEHDLINLGININKGE